MIIKEVEAQLAKKPPQTVVELAQEYKTSTWFTNLSERTKKDYEPFILALVTSPYGLQPLKAITPRIADVIYAQVLAQHGEHSASKFVAVWRRIYEFADKYEYCERNPWRKVEVTTPKAREVSWTEDQVFAVIEKALELGKKALAIAVTLMYDTGQRPSDILYMTYANIKKDDLGYYLDLVQNKRKAHVKPALSKYTIGLLGGDAAITAREPTDLVVDTYKNLTALQYDFALVREELGYKGIQMRDLRRTCITEMGAASDDQMVAVSGHKDRSMLNVYSLRSRQKALEAQRIRHVTTNSRLNKEFPSPARAEETI
jgi:integrase